MMTLIDDLRQQLADLPAEEGVQWVSDRFGSRARFSTSLGMEDQIITHWIGNRHLPIEVFTLDTGRLFQETYDLLTVTRDKYKMVIKSYLPDTVRLQQLLEEKGPNSFYFSVENRKECCTIRKVEPLRRALRDANVWITGIRADQSGNRGNMPVIEWDEQYRVIKYNPILHWSTSQVEKYIEDHHIPVNTLHKKGFPSIGCAPCTRAIEAGEDLRAGRWWWENSNKECGLHETSQTTNATA